MPFLKKILLYKKTLERDRERARERDKINKKFCSWNWTFVSEPQLVLPIEKRWALNEK